MVNCSAAWIENENGILLEKRGDDANWGLIGGVMELGESAEDTIIREVNEETGTSAKAHKLIGVYTDYHHEYPNGDQVQPVVFFFSVTIDPNATLTISDESIELRYFAQEDLPALGMLQHRDMANDALAGRTGIYR